MTQPLHISILENAPPTPLVTFNAFVQNGLSKTDVSAANIDDTTIKATIQNIATATAQAYSPQIKTDALTAEEQETLIRNLETVYDFCNIAHGIMDKADEKENKYAIDYQWLMNRAAVRIQKITGSKNTPMPKSPYL